MRELKQIDKLSDINKIQGANDSLMFKEACEELWVKTNEIIGRYNKDAEAMLRYAETVGKKGEEFYIRLMELSDLVVDK